MRRHCFDALRHYRFEIGQPVSYAEDSRPHVWEEGYEIVRLHPLGSDEPQYAIRNADQSSDRVVFEHELCEDLGAGMRGRWNGTRGSSLGLAAPEPYGATFDSLEEHAT
jgi:hypothetical protein